MQLRPGTQVPIAAARSLKLQPRGQWEASPRGRHLGPQQGFPPTAVNPTGVGPKVPPLVVPHLTLYY